MGYREAAPVLALVEPIKEHRGPRKECPVCGSDYKVGTYGNHHVHATARACTGASWFGRLFGGCKRRVIHLHQHCPSCKARWTCAPKETE